MADWPAIERGVIDGFFRFSPTHGRFVGDHRFDGVVGDPSKTAIRARVAEIDRQLPAIEAAAGLDRNQEIDRRALVAQLQAARFELTELRLPFREPMFYAGESDLDVSFYLKRPYAPLGERLSMKAAAFALSGVGRLKAAQKFGRLAQWPFEKDGHLHHLPGLLGAWTETRDLPAIPDESFRDWWAKREKAKRA